MRLDQHLTELRKTLLLARPGYVVGNMRVRAGLTINALQVAFVGAAEGKLDADDCSLA